MKIADFSDFSYYQDIVICNYLDLHSAIPKIEKIVRSSKEYKAYLRCVRETDDIKGCSFFVEKDLQECTLHIHHIIQLYDLCDIAGKKLLKTLKEGECLLLFDVAQEVLNMHFKDMIPVISLTQTIHELYHAGQYNLPKSSKQLHLGEWKEFIKEYHKFIDKGFIKNTYEYFDEINNEEFEKYLKEYF